MTYRISDIEIPDSNPFKYDALDRKDTVCFIRDLIQRLEGPFVLAIDAPWGSGKTTIIRMLESVLKTENFSCINFNAWQIDYVTDPLVALIAAIEQNNLACNDPENKLKDKFKSIRRITSLIAKRGAIATAKVITVGALDLEKEIETAMSELSGGVIGDIIDSFNKEKELLSKLRSELTEIASLNTGSTEKKPIIFFIDELDRCRPTFAIELLERVKHIFDVPNIIFVLSIDKKQLEASTTAVYGNKINAPEYLRRFIDLEFSLPETNATKHTEFLINKFNLTNFFEDRKSYEELRYDRDNFVKFFTKLSSIFGLSIRARERCFTRLKLVLDKTPTNHYLEPILVSLLIILRIKEPDLFQRFCLGHASSDEIIDHIKKLPNGESFIGDRGGIILETYLIAADPNQKRASAKRQEIKENFEKNNSDNDTQARLGNLINLIGRIPGPMRDTIDIDLIASKIDLVMRIRD